MNEKVREYIEKYVIQYVNDIKNHGINYSEQLAKKYIPWIYRQHQIKAIYRMYNKNYCDIDIYLITSKKNSYEVIPQEKISDNKLQNLKNTADKILPVYGITYNHMTTGYAGIRASKIINRIFNSILI